MRYRINEIKLNIDEPKERLKEKLEKRIGARALEWRISKESIDARDKENIFFVYSLDFDADFSKKLKAGKGLPKGVEALHSESCRPGDVGLGEALRFAQGFGSEGGGGGLEFPRFARERVNEDVRAGVEVPRYARKGVNEDVRAGVEFPRFARERVEDRPRPVVVGFGPCGMFCALYLAEAGLRPIVLERGRPVDERAQDVESFWKGGALNPESNVQFGEGGAGTFSDGKLTTNTKDPRIGYVLATLHKYGANEDILYKQRPHVGTDVLREVVKNIRERIIALGGEIRFSSRLEGFCFEGGRLRAVRVRETLRFAQGFGDSDAQAGVEVPRFAREGVKTDAREGTTVISTEGEARVEKSIYELPCDTLVIAIGHSARDTFRMLNESGFKMEQKPFSIGVRVEHPQELISRAQYGHLYKKLPPADYKLSMHLENGRGVYSFCMCPGGEIINASSQEGGVCTNGMSLRARDGDYANSGLLVDVRTSDFVPFCETGAADPLAGVRFQEHYEHLAFLSGGADYRLPQTRYMAFKEAYTEINKICGLSSKEANGTGSVGISVSAVSGNEHSINKNPIIDRNTPVTIKLQKHVTTKDINPVLACLPSFAAEGLVEAMPYFGKKISGFDGPEAVFKGIEARSSSPVRILRDKNTLEALNFQGIYPAGEGAGYAGGIVSAAVDGLKVAERIIGVALG